MVIHFFVCVFVPGSERDTFHPGDLTALQLPVASIVSSERQHNTGTMLGILPGDNDYNTLLDSLRSHDGVFTLRGNSNRFSIVRNTKLEALKRITKHDIGVSLVYVSVKSLI